MLEQVDIRKYLATGKIEGVTCGGESGPDARVCDFSWILDSMEQCVEYDVPFWFKQTGAMFKKGNKAVSYTHLILAERIQTFPDGETLIKYKAVLEFEQSNDLELNLNIANNLNCYELDPSIISLECYAEQVFQKAGIDTDDPSFAYFDFRGYGERYMLKKGDVYKRQALSRLKKKYTVTPAIKYSIFIRMPPISHYSNTFRTCS